MGKLNIIICQGSSCFSRGNKKNLKAIQNYLKDQGLSAEVSFKGQLCSGHCKNGPVIIVNNTLYEAVTETSAVEIIKAHLIV
jgi:NADH:ubiquinone oxidoreductase subunit E